MPEHPELKFGDRLLESLELKPSETVFATMDIPWKAALPRLGPDSGKPERIVYVESMERAELDLIAESLGDFDVAVGIGGGSCMDCAKYLAWKKGSRLVLIPSIVSVDACVTHLVAVREEGRVRNVGHAQAESVLVDYTLISSAPARLNRAGAADILSIHTASHDWRADAANTGEEYSEDIARRCEDVVTELEQSAAEIREVTRAGIRKLVELFEDENDLCLELGNYRPEEGSEHFFAYNAEHATGKHFIHGELVFLGILLMSRLQKNRPDWVKNLLDEFGALYRPTDIGMTTDELKHILLTLADYCRNENLPHTIIYDAEITPDIVEELVSDLI